MADALYGNIEVDAPGDCDDWTIRPGDRLQRTLKLSPVLV